METKFAQWAPFRSDLREQFGYLSFNCTLINLDIIGIKLLRTGDVVVITYRGARKTGFIYEGGQLTDQQVFRIFTDMPMNYNELARYEQEYAGRIEILAPPRDNYVFISEQEVSRK
ncbi:hypothetical protein [Chryseobacterium oncorhynchi]|uniref:Uncharacterized protein n=1 Tax=Chryseobacterium oncorhynchi TaxID=741074 RepID=A0A316X1R4_9FLAO|nr:hypothetical protein [Chryseobacterium oncorhynchi]PWN67625.1 hypothetical protein C1638_003270 [Chryseobacterium oncorhynchi]